MSVKSLYSMKAGEFLSSLVPDFNDIKFVYPMPEYTPLTNPRYMDFVGSLCDYGVRSHFKCRSYAYVELGMAMRKYDSELERVLSMMYLEAEDAYTLYLQNNKSGGELSEDIVTDYDVLVRRAASLYKLFAGLKTPYIGKFYKYESPIEKFECDYVDDDSVLDLKVTRNDDYNHERWLQVLSYSVMAYISDNTPRPTIGLVLPVQGFIQYYTYPADKYRWICDKFKEVF